MTRLPTTQADGSGVFDDYGNTIQDARPFVVSWSERVCYSLTVYATSPFEALALARRNCEDAEWTASGGMDDVVIEGGES